MNTYDTIIIGAGPAGLSAALYSGRAMQRTLLLERSVEGGQILQTSEIVNYPGGIFGENGVSLIERMMYQIREFGVELVYDEVEEIELKRGIKEIVCKNNTYKARTVIIATGVVPRRIGCPGEDEFIGRGVSHCATCDGAFFKGLDVYVVGGGDAAIEEALFLTRFARAVTIIHRSSQFRAAKSIMDKAEKSDKITFMTDTVVREIKGEGVVNALTVENRKTGEIKEIKAREGDRALGIFVFVGMVPQTGLFEQSLELKNGYIVTDDFMHTSEAGVYAVGDIREKSLRQVVTAVSDGAIGAVEAEKYMEDQKK